MLVSIVVITYNSSKTIVETLESILSQDYRKLEIIISDDGSSDNTIDIINEWLGVNKYRFINSLFIYGFKNVGISGNLNRGIRASSGFWIKPIAGDDKLIFNAISKFIAYADGDDEPCFISKLKLFGDVNPHLFTQVQNDYQNCYKKLKKSIHAKKKNLLIEMFIPGPGIFYSRSTFDKVGGYDEDYPIGDEWPFFYKLLKAGKDIRLIDEELVLYRLSGLSTCRPSEYVYEPNIKLFLDTKRFFFKVRFKSLIFNGMILIALKQALYYHLESFIRLHSNRFLAGLLFDIKKLFK